MIVEQFESQEKASYHYTLMKSAFMKKEISHFQLLLQLKADGAHFSPLFP